MNENRTKDGWASNRQPGPSLLYSREHVLLATMLATPVAGALLLCENLRRLGHRREGWLIVFTVTAATASVVGIAMFVAKGEGRHPLVFLSSELVFLAGMYLVFEWRMQARMQAHLAAGGKTGITWWHAPAAVVGGYLIFFVAVIATFALARLGPTLIWDRMNRCVTMTRKIWMREFVCYGKGTTERDARELGEALLRGNVFQRDRAQRVDVERASGMLLISLLVPARHDFESEDHAHGLAAAGEGLSKTIYRGQPFELRLCRGNCKEMKIVFASRAVAFAANPAGDAEHVVTMENVTLWIPERRLAARIGSRRLADYIQRVTACVDDQAHKLKLTTPGAFTLTAAVKPGRRGRVWVDDPAGALQPPGRAQIEKECSAVTAPTVRNAPIAFSLSISVRGGPVPDLASSTVAPSAFAVAARAAGRTLGMEEAIAAAWPDTPEDLAQLTATPLDVKYARLPPEKTAAAKQRVSELFGASPRALAPLFHQGTGATIIGPLLACRLRSADPAGAKKLTPAKFKWPMKDGQVAGEMLGFGISTAEQTRTIGELFAAVFPPKGAVHARSLTADELAVVWFMIGWDLADPLFVIEQGDERFVLQLDGDHLRYLEEIHQPCIRVADNRTCRCAVPEPEGKRFMVRWEESGCLD